MLFSWSQVVVFAAKGNHDQRRIIPRHPSYHVAEQSRTVNHETGFDTAAGGFQNGFGTALGNSQDFRGGEYRTARLANHVRVLLADQSVVRDASRWHKKSAQASTVRLNLKQCLAR